MYLIADASGPIGRAVIEQLLGQGQLVRILTTDVECRTLWRGRGVDVNEGDPKHSASWVKAFDGVETVILISPPYARKDGSLKDSGSYRSAFMEAFADLSKEVKVVLLSAMGAEAKLGWTNQLGELENQIGRYSENVTTIRSTFLMENLAPSLSMAKHHSVFPSFLVENISFPMVATKDLVSVLVSAAVEPITGHNLLELHGPQPYSLDDIVEAGRNVLSKHIASLSLPEDQWHQILRDQGLDAESASLWAVFYSAMNSGEIQPDPNATPIAGDTVLSDALFQMWKNLRQRERAAIDPEKKVYAGLE